MLNKIKIQICSMPSECNNIAIKAISQVIFLIEKYQNNMEAGIECKSIALAGLAPYFSGEQQDKRTVLLVDHTGNAYTFFKYKARLIDCATLATQVAIQYKSRQDAMEEVRKGLAYGIKQGEVVVLHLGENTFDWEEFFKGQKFWNPKELFKPVEKFETEWYRKNVMKPDDKDMFGNQGALYPADNFLLMVSFTKEIEFGNLKWLKDCKQYFFKLKIE